MKNHSTRHLCPMLRLFVLALFLMGAACAHHEPYEGEEGTLEEVETLTSGHLSKIGGKGPKTIFISIHDPAGKLIALPGDARGALIAKGLSLVDSPSRAAWILQVSVLGEGSASPENFRAQVNEGYGAPLKFSGHGIDAVIADILLVKRRVPTARRPSQERLKNIGQTNALGSSEMRIGLFVPHETPRHPDLPEYFSQALANGLIQALDGSQP